MLIFSPTIANKRCPLYVFFNMRSKISFLFHFFLTNITLVDFITLARLAIRRQLVVKCGHLPGQSGCRPNAHLPHNVAAAGLARHARQRGQLRGQRLPRHLLRPGALLGVLGQHGEFLQGARARPRDVGAGGAGGGHGEHSRILRRVGGRTLLHPARAGDLSRLTSSHLLCNPRFWRLAVAVVFQVLLHRLWVFTMIITVLHLTLEPVCGKP